MTFLKAQWKDLIMINYQIPEHVVLDYLPKGCEIDFEQGKTFASLVLFQFEETKVMGIKWPLHVNFSEINLRLYVTYKDGQNKKRGVVFVREFVPKPIIATLARLLYKEPYRSVPIDYKIKNLSAGRNISYHWDNKNIVEVKSLDSWSYPSENSHQYFIIDHNWGYTKVSNNKTNEYQVTHPAWRTSEIGITTLKLDFAELYGEKWNFLNNQIPYSSFIAEGSEIKVMGKEQTDS
jgi:uncharacterized protein